MGTRSVYRDHVLDNKGEPVAGASVYLYAQHTTSPIAATIYANDSDHPTAPAATLTNPLTTATDGSYRFYLADPTRIDVKITKTGLQDVTKTIDVTKVANKGDPGAIAQLQDEGTNLTVRGTVNFTGAGVTAADDATNSRTNVAIPGSDVYQVLSVITEHNPAAAGFIAVTSTTFVDVDATNLAVTFTAPSNGIVLVHLNAVTHHTTAGNDVYWGLREGTTDLAGSTGMVSGSARGRVTHTVRISGLVTGSTHTYKWAHRVDAGEARLYRGGTYGPATMEVAAGT